MPLEKIYIARHGFRLNWVSTSWHSATGLARDPPLAAYGETQAQELANYFLNLQENERPTAIFSSPYYRCLQTAQPTARALGIPIYVEHGISEWYSPVVPGSGLHPRPANALSLKSYFAEIDPSWSPVWYPSQRGEDVAEVHDRSDGFLSVFFPEIDRVFPDGQHTKILMVSHAATIITLVRSLVGDRELDLRVGCCSLSELVPRLGEGGNAGSTGWEAQKLADGDHLSQGAAREWGFEHIEIEAGKVVEDPGVPGTEDHHEGPTGCQLTYTSLL